MAISKAEIENFKCLSRSGNCILKGKLDSWDEYEIKDSRLLFRGEVLGDLSNQSIADIICYEHCHNRFVDEVLGAPEESKPRLRVVKRYSKPRFLLPQIRDEEEDDF